MAAIELIAPRGAEDFLGAGWGRDMEVFRGTTDCDLGLLTWTKHLAGKVAARG
jgi:hypothetical protein